MLAKRQLCVNFVLKKLFCRNGNLLFRIENSYILFVFIVVFPNIKSLCVISVSTFQFMIYYTLHISIQFLCLDVFVISKGMLNVKRAHYF